MENVLSDENRAFFYIKAFNTVDTKYDRCDYGLSMKLLVNLYSSSKSETIKELKKNRNVIVYMDEAFGKEKCNFGLDYEKGFKRELPFKSTKVRAAVYMLVFQALQDIEKGDSNIAVKRIEQCLKLSDDLSESHILMTEFLAIAVGYVSIDFIDYMLEKKVVADYTPLVNELEKLELKTQTNFIKAVEVERATGLLCYDEFLASPRRSIFLFKPYFLMDKLFYLSVMTERLKMINDNSYEEKYNDFEQNVRKKLPYYTLAPFVLPEFYKGYMTNRKLILKCNDILEKLSTVQNKIYSLTRANNRFASTRVRKI